MKESGNFYDQFKGTVKRTQISVEYIQHTQMSKANLRVIANGDKTGFSIKEVVVVTEIFTRLDRIYHQLEFTVLPNSSETMNRARTRQPGRVCYT